MDTDILELTPEKKEPLKWKNTDIKNYYEKIPVKILQSFAISGGLEDGCDVNLVYPYIANAHSLIDAGSGYGRVIKSLLKKKFSGKIYAIERSSNFCQYLFANYGDKAEIIQEDIRDFYPKIQVDAILWMWSGIGDFSKKEQLPILKHMCTWLKKDGVFILETILHSLKPKNVSIDQNQNFIVFSEHGTAYGYKPCAKEMQSYGEKLGFSFIKHINYETTTKRERLIHIFSNRLI